MQTHRRMWLAPILTVLTIQISSCKDSKRSPRSDTRPDPKDSGLTSDAGESADSAIADCYEDPKTYLQIINACTDAERVSKEPDLPLLMPNGKLPPLP